MSSTAQEFSITTKQYLAHKGEDLLSQVQKVICILSPGSIVTAGFHPSGEVLMINASVNAHQNWDMRFFEEHIVNDVLWVSTDLIAGIFVASEKELIIPESLYSVEDAKAWLHKTYFIDAQEAIGHLHLQSQSAHCVYAYPQSLNDVLGQFLENFTIKPLCCAHFQNKVVDVLQVCIGEQYAFASLHKGHHLVWHQMFEYQNAEDIVYQITAAAQRYEIVLQEHLLTLSTVLPQLQSVQKAVKDYFPLQPNKKSSIVDVIAPEWSSTVFLFQHLYPCVS